MSKAGGSSRRARCRVGFTLIELLVVTTIVGVLAGIAIIKVGDSRKRAQIAVMKSDLHNFATIAESQFASDGSYANVVAPPASDGVTLALTLAPMSWSATATYTGQPGLVCTLGVGGPGDAAASSDPVCSGP